MSWSVGLADDISLVAREEFQPARVVARVTTSPQVRAAQGEPALSGRPQLDRSSCTIQCESIESLDENTSVSGLARLSVSGHLLHVGVGDVIEVFGQIVRPAPPLNPGQFDYSSYLRAQGVRTIIFADHPDQIRRLKKGYGGNPRRWSTQLRDECDDLFAQNLSARVSPIASALLLGDRTHMTDDIREAFTRSGTMHVLAISGLHVGILAGLIWFACRQLSLSPTSTAVVVMTLIIGYAFVTETRPPIVRAVILISLVVAGQIRFRQAALLNSTAIAAVIILAYNPTDLFDTGAQLSFLAIAGIAFASRRRTDAAGQNDAGTIAVRLRQSRVNKGVAGDCWRFLCRGYWITFMIWVFTAPLVAAKFHLISPMALLINVALIPVVAVVLWLGYAFLFAGLLIPPAAWAIGRLFDTGLSLLLGVVDRAAQLGFSHTYLPTIPLWWLWGYYGLLLLVFGFPQLLRSPGRRWCVLCAWLVLGLATGLRSPEREGMRCTFLSMGHGCSVLLELPGGKTLLYDAGSLHSDTAARSIVQNVLWQRGLSTVDVAVLSHADVDHFNAMPGLLSTTSIGSLLVGQGFLDYSQPAVGVLCEAAWTKDVPIQLVGRGDRLLIDDRTVIEVTHPSSRPNSRSDNENSVVISIVYAGRKILLLGDLEADGLRELLAGPPMAADIMLSPHHGSAAANPPDLADQVRPAHVVVSSRSLRMLPRLRETYGAPTHVHSTRDAGAVTFDISPDGTIHYSYFRP